MQHQQGIPGKWLSSAESSRWMRTIIPLALIVLPMAIQAFVVARLGVNVLIYDEYDTIPFVQQVYQGGSWLQMLPMQHNEHRTFTLRVALALLARLSSWNVVVEMCFSLLLAALTLLGLWLIYRKFLASQGLWGFAPVAWVFFSLGQYENMLYGMQMGFYFAVLGAVWAIALLSIPSTRATFLAGLCAVFSMFSTNSGLIVWPVGLAILFAARAGKSRFAAWILVFAISMFLYATNYVQITYHPSPLLALRQPLATAEFALAVLGAPLGGGNFNFALVTGIGIVIFLLALASHKLLTREPLTDAAIVAGGLVLLALLGAGSVAVGRVGFGLEFALTSRYTTFTSLGLIGIYLILLDGRKQDAPVRVLTCPELAAFLCVGAIGLSATNLYGWHKAKEWHLEQVRNKYILQTYEIQPDEALARLFPLVDKVRSYVPFLQQSRLNAFSDPMDVLLPIRWQEGVTSGEIVPGRPVIQEFTCNVPTLTDLSVAVTTQGRQTASQLVITLHDEDNLITSRAISTTEMKTDEWVSLRLPDPVDDCAGKRLRITVQSQDAAPGNAVMAWTYPRYYDGDLAQEGNAAIAGRSLGLEINTLAHGLR